ncbi:hypothetical protein JXQ70_13395 [bacterium]|nr:hypothetical protein [bacterium]
MSKKICIIILVLFINTIILDKQIFADEFKIYYEDEEYNEDIYRLKKLKRSGLVFSSIGLGVFGIGSLYYNDYLEDKDNEKGLDYPAYQMGVSFMSVGSIFLGIGSYLFFKNRNKLKKLEADNFDCALVAGISKDSIGVHMCLSFNLNDIVRKLSCTGAHQNRRLKAEKE